MATPMQVSHFLALQHPVWLHLRQREAPAQGLLHQARSRVVYGFPIRSRSFLDLRQGWPEVWLDLQVMPRESSVELPTESAIS